MGRKRPRAKTKTVLKPVKQWDQHGNMQNWISKSFLNKNHPINNLVGYSLAKHEEVEEPVGGGAVDVDQVADAALTFSCLLPDNHGIGWS